MREDQKERLSILMEEMGETLQAMGKIQRHGYESGWPTANGQNRRDLETEIGHVQYALTLMCKAGDIDETKILMAQDRKAIDIEPYLHHQGRKK